MEEADGFGTGHINELENGGTEEPGLTPGI